MCASCQRVNRLPLSSASPDRSATGIELEAGGSVQIWDGCWVGAVSPADQPLGSCSIARARMCIIRRRFPERSQDRPVRRGRLPRACPPAPDPAGHRVRRRGQHRAPRPGRHPAAYRGAMIARESLDGSSGGAGALDGVDDRVHGPSRRPHCAPAHPPRAGVLRRGGPCSRRRPGADAAGVRERRLNAEIAAQRLHVHVNTAYYRLERISERTGCDLRSFADLEELLIAIRLLGGRRPGA